MVELVSSKVTPTRLKDISTPDFSSMNLPTPDFTTPDFGQISKRMRAIAQLRVNYTDAINPIPTGHGRNQSIYERHVTTAGRNRVNRMSL